MRNSHQGEQKPFQKHNVEKLIEISKGTAFTQVSEPHVCQLMCYSIGNTDLI